ncbi:MAG: hypothetical protein NTV11_02905 [Rhodocyclales bacterium]|nr:hypothetical protein [Rhodocyclales bacterium]
MVKKSSEAADYSRRDLPAGFAATTKLLPVLVKFQASRFPVNRAAANDRSAIPVSARLRVAVVVWKAAGKFIAHPERTRNRRPMSAA